MGTFVLLEKSACTISIFTGKNTGNDVSCRKYGIGCSKVTSKVFSFMALIPTDSNETLPFFACLAFFMEYNKWTLGEGNIGVNVDFHVFS